MTTCANALETEIGLSSVGDDHDSEDDVIYDYNDDSYDIGITEKDLDITVFLDQALPIEDDVDDEFGDDYVDADDDDADGRKLRLFSPKKEGVSRRTKSISKEAAPFVLPYGPPRRSSSRRCSELLKTALNPRSSSTTKTKRTQPKSQPKTSTRSLEKVPIARSSPVQQTVTITKSGRKSKASKAKKESILIPETRTYIKKKYKTKVPIAEKLNALYTEFPKLQESGQKDLDDFFKKVAISEISAFNKTNEMPHGERPFIDKELNLTISDYTIPSRLTVVLLNPIYKYEFHGLITELKKKKGKNGTMGKIHVKDVDPPFRKRQRNLERKQIIQPAPTRNATNVTTIKAGNIVNLGNTTTANQIVINNGNSIQLGNSNIITLGNTGGIQVLDLSQLSQLLNQQNDGKQQQMVQILQPAQQAQSFQVVRPVTVVPMQNVTTFQNVTSVKPVAKEQPKKQSAVKVEKKPQSPSPATSTPVSVSAAAANKLEGKKEVKEEPACEEVFIDTSEKQLMPPPPTPIMPKLEEKMHKPILPNLAPSQVFKIDTSSNSFELMPPPAIPRRKLSIKDRLINSPEQPIRVPKLELVRKDPKKKSKESTDEKVIVIKPTEEEKKRLEESEDSYEMPVLKDRPLIEQQMIIELDRQVEEKLRQERERAVMRMKSNILRRTDSASRRSSPVPAKSTQKPIASPKKTSTLASSSESPKKVAPKTEKPPPVNIKPTIIENNSTLIRSLPDGCQLLPIFNLTQAFTTISASNIITVVQSKPNKVPIPQNTSSSKINSFAPSSSPSQTAAQSSPKKSAPVSIQPKSSNNPIEHSVNLLNKANPGANEHKITLKIGGGESPVKAEPGLPQADSADRFVSFKNQQNTSSTMSTLGATNPPNPKVAISSTPRKLEPAIKRVRNDSGQESGTVTKIRARAGSIGKNALKASTLQKQASPIMRRTMIRKRTETFSEAHLAEILDDKTANITIQNDDFKSIRNLIAETVKRSVDDEPNYEKNEFEDFDVGLLDEPVFMDNIQPEGFLILPNEGVQEDPEYLNNLLRINDNDFLPESPLPMSFESGRSSPDSESPLSPSESIKEERLSPILDEPMDELLGISAEKRGAAELEHSPIQPRRKRRKPERPVKIEETDDEMEVASGHVHSACTLEESTHEENELTSSIDNFSYDYCAEVKEEPMEYVETDEPIESTPGIHANLSEKITEYIEESEENIKEEMESEQEENGSETASEIESDDHEDLEDIDGKIGYENDFEREMNIWKSTEEWDFIERHSERLFTRSPTELENDANLELLRAAAKEFDVKFPPASALNKSKVSPGDSGFDDEEPLSPDSEDSCSPHQFSQFEEEISEKQISEERGPIPDRNSIPSQKFFSPSKLDTPPDTPPQDSSFEDERNAEDIEALARNEMLRKITGLEGCPKVRDVSIHHVALDRYRITKRIRTRSNDKRRTHSRLERGFVLQVAEKCSSAGIYNMIKDFAQEAHIRSVQEVSTRKHLVMLSTENGRERFYKALDGVKRSFGWKIRPADESILQTLYDQKI